MKNVYVLKSKDKLTNNTAKPYITTHSSINSSDPLANVRLGEYLKSEEEEKKKIKDDNKKKLDEILEYLATSESSKYTPFDLSLYYNLNGRNYLQRRNRVKNDYSRSALWDYHSLFDRKFSNGLVLPKIETLKGSEPIKYDSFVEYRKVELDKKQLRAPLLTEKTNLMNIKLPSVNEYYNTRTLKFNNK